MTIPLRIAVLLNGLSSPNTAEIEDSFQTAISSASSLNLEAAPPTIDFYDPIVAQIHPDPVGYDLIVLSGGTADPMGADPWVLKLQDYLRATVRDFPRQKILGICWGHQTICVTFGGSVGSIEGAAEVGVTRLPLTAAGRKMFPFAAAEGAVRLHEFHGREVRTAALGFVALAEGNQCFLGGSNTILTFQGHPELNEVVARTLLEHAPAYMGVGGERKADLFEKAGLDHDGVEVWARILKWVRE